MADTMHDRGRFWSPAPDFSQAPAGGGDGWSARRRPGLGQTLLSGDLNSAIAALSPGAAEVGLWAVADAPAYAVRAARDRALLVTPAPLDLEPGWRDGYVATPCDDAYAVIELSGPAIVDIIAEATAVDLGGGSRSAALLFAGVPALLYRSDPDTARLHVEAPLAAYIWTWLEGRS